MIKEKILTIIEDQFGREQGSVRLTDNLVEDLGGDSVDVLEIAMMLESEFGIKISSDESSKSLIIEQLVKLVETKCQK